MTVGQDWQEYDRLENSVRAIKRREKEKARVRASERHTSDLVFPFGRIRHFRFYSSLNEENDAIIGYKHFRPEMV